VNSPRILLALALLPLLVAVPALAAKKAPKPLKHLQSLVDEVATAGAVSDDAFKALRYADRCLVADKNWERGMDNQIPINQLYEQVGGAVTCWQTAEKKLARVGESVAVPATWVSARARYIEAFRGYLWGIDAKLGGKRNQVCRRLREATVQAVAANEASASLADKFKGEAARLLAAAAEQMSGQLGQTIAAEFKHQKCD
jgi:hypothetical protein